MSLRSTVIVNGARTAIGAFGGGLKSKTPCELAGLVTKEALARSGVAPEDVGHVVFGNVIHTEARDMFLGRVAGVEAGVPHNVPALTLNRLCGSGLQAIITAAQGIMIGDTDVAVAGGAEVMSRAGHLVSGARWGTKMGDSAMIDMLVQALHDPFENGHMGVTAENVASTYGITREQQDALAEQSHNRAAHSICNGHFDEQIVPVEVTTRGRTASFARDEHVRGDVSLADLEQLRPVFRKNGVVTAGNSSGINDAAAAVVLMDEEEAARCNLKPLGRILAYGHAGVDPALMGIGPVTAVRSMLARIGLETGDFDVIESNEAFAAQACAVTNELGLDPAKVNPNGGAIALGHPIGATGTIITLKLLHELKRIGGRYGLATMCIGGGQGIAMAVEAM